MNSWGKKNSQNIVEIRRLERERAKEVKGVKINRSCNEIALENSPWKPSPSKIAHCLVLFLDFFSCPCHANLKKLGRSHLPPSTPSVLRLKPFTLSPSSPSPLSPADCCPTLPTIPYGLSTLAGAETAVSTPERHSQQQNLIRPLPPPSP